MTIEDIVDDGSSACNKHNFLRLFVESHHLTLGFIMPLSHSSDESFVIIPLSHSLYELFLMVISITEPKNHH